MAEPKGFLVVPVGFRVDGSIHALELDTSDRLKVLVDAITGSVTVVQTDPSQLLVTLGGIKKGARGAGIQQNTSDTNLGAGTSTLALPDVPASHVYGVKSITFRYLGTVAGVTLRPRLNIGGTALEVTSIETPVSGHYYDKTLDFPLAAADNVELIVTGATAGDDVYLYAFYEDLT